jgi:hypothetical protein
MPPDVMIGSQMGVWSEDNFFRSCYNCYSVSTVNGAGTLAAWIGLLNSYFKGFLFLCQGWCYRFGNYAGGLVGQMMTGSIASNCYASEKCPCP